MYCSKCGLQLPAILYYCPRCGKEVLRQPIKTNTTQAINQSTKQNDFIILNPNAVINNYLTTSHSYCPQNVEFGKFKREEFRCILKNIHREYVAIDESVRRKNRTNGNLSYYTRNISKSTMISELKDFVVIDTETTGLKPDKEKIIEIAAIRFCDFRPTEVFSTYLDPQKRIPNAVVSITGIDNEITDGSPTFPQIQQSLERFIKNSMIVMHNAKFDLAFLYYSGCCINNNIQPIYDTLPLSKKYIKYHGEKLSTYCLENCCWVRNIRIYNSHGAESDALATGLLFNEIVKEHFKTDNLLSLL